MGIDLKNYKRSEILAYLQGNRLACHSFVDAHRRHRTAGSETETLFFTAVVVARVLAFSHGSFLSLRSCRATQRGRSDASARSVEL